MRSYLLPHAPYTVVEEKARHLGHRHGPGLKCPLVDGIASLDVQAEKPGVSGHPSLASNAITIESPIRNSACPMVPSSLGTRAISSAPNASLTKSRSSTVSLEMIHGVTAR